MRGIPLRPRLGQRVVECNTSTGTCLDYYGLAATPAYLHRDLVEVSADDYSVLVQEHDCSMDQARNETLGLNPTECMEGTHIERS